MSEYYRVLQSPEETTTTVVAEEPTASTTVQPELGPPPLVLIRTEDDCQPVSPEEIEGGGTFYVDPEGDHCTEPTPRVTGNSEEPAPPSTTVPEPELIPPLVLIRTEDDCQPIDPRETEGGGTFYVDPEGDYCTETTPRATEPSVIAVSDSEPVVAVTEHATREHVSQLAESGSPVEPLIGIALGLVAIGAVFKCSGAKLNKEIVRRISREQLNRVEKLTQLLSSI